MQDYGNSKLLTGKTIVFFIVLMIVAFLPVSSFQFFLKNDAFSGYFPPKFFMSESLHDGILPLWNPYINFGLPQYGDMSSGYWSPITWLIAATVGYNAYSFTIEVLLYLFIAGIGMYTLCKLYQFKNIVCLIAGASYMCSGYIVGHMQHFNWISGAAFLPLAFWSYNKLLSSFSFKNVLTAALCVYMLMASAHPGIIIGAIYFFIAYALFHLFYTNYYSLQKRLTVLLKANLILLFAIALLGAGIIIGYADILPSFIRAEKPASNAITSPSNLKSWISLLYPLATVKNENWFATDISMRNMYMGITMMLFFLFALLNKKTKEQVFFLAMGFFFLVLASGGWISMLLYKLPFLGYVRLPGEYVIFSVLSFIMVASFSLNNFIQNKRNDAKLLLVLKSLFILFIAISSWALIKIITSHESLVFTFSKFTVVTSMAAKMKMIIDSISFYDTLVLQGIIQLIVLALIFYAVKNKKYYRLVYIVASDLIIATLLNLPFTAVGQASVKSVQHVLNESPKGITIPKLQPIFSNDSGTETQNFLLGYWSFYNKQPGAANYAPYPIVLRNTDSIFSNTNRQYFLKPLVFSSQGTSVITINKFSGQQIDLMAIATNPDTIVWQQTYYPHWKLLVDDKPAMLINYRGIYPAAAIEPGKHILRFEFKPRSVQTAMMVSAVAIPLTLAYLLFIWIFPSWQQKRLRP